LIKKKKKDNRARKKGTKRPEIREEGQAKGKKGKNWIQAQGKGDGL